MKKPYYYAFRISSFLSLAALSVVFINTTEVSQKQTDQCSKAELDIILAKTTEENLVNHQLNCSLNLSKNQIVAKKLIINSSNIQIKCNGAKVNGLDIHSIEKKEGWMTPQSIIIEGCEFTSPVRIYGLGRNGEAEKVLLSSHQDLQHTKRAQEIAPRNIEIRNSIFKSTTGIPLYLSPGVTKVKILNNNFMGSSTSTALYLDAESGNNLIENNRFSIETNRELIAIDGSSHNIIRKNTFNPSANRSAIAIYRNCGEGGTVRHQQPVHNQIRENTFTTTSVEAIYVGSRQGRRNYCNQDQGIFNSGNNSSFNNADFANHNLITENTFILPILSKGFISKYQVVLRGDSNTFSKNKIISEQRPLSCDQYIKKYGNHRVENNLCTDKYKKTSTSNTRIFLSS